MKLCFKISLLLISLVFVAFVAQQSGIQQVIDRFQKYQEDYPQEKVYLHTDKPYYAVGDEIWFKAYVLNAKTMGASFKSNLLYVELLDTDNKLKKRIRIALSAGTGWGNFNLADTLKEGNYRIRAYTNWMRNFDSEFYYDKTYKVANIRTSQLITETSYEFTKTASGQEITAAINYKNIDGIPYANKEVVYSAELDGKLVGRGKTSTDDKGNALIKFNSNKPDIQRSGILTTTLNIAENTTISKFIPITQVTDEISLQFFPEGGDLVSGIRSKVGFKALRSDGKGVNVKGHVQDEAGTPIAIINSRYKGMGSFFLAPEEGKRYEAVIKFEDGTEKKYQLPAVKSEGLVISVLQNNPDSMTVRLMANAPFVKSNLGKSLTLVAHSSGNLVYSAQTTLSEIGGFVVKFPLRDFPLGITHLTLFNSINQPVLERLVFVHKPNLLNLAIEADKKAYKQREKVQMSLKVTNPAGQPFVGSFSMAVIDEGKLQVNEEEESTILSELLLNSDLKGHIETPNYYFHNQDDKKRQDLDNLLLTQGWRRFNWSNIISGAPISIRHQAEQTLAIRGRVKNNKKVVPNASIIVFGTGTGAIMTTTANEQGEFVLDSLFFPDSAKFVIQARSERGKKFVEIEMDDNIDTEVIPPSHQSDLTVNIGSSMLAYLKSSKTQYEELLKYGMTSRAIMLEEVKVVEKRKQLENSSNLNGGGNADRVVSGEELQNAPTLEFALQGKVPGMIIQNGEIYFMRNMGRPAQIILDGMYVESDMLNSINPNDVESVEILRTPGYTAIYGSMGGGGVIIINTKRGSSGGFSNTYSPGIITYNPLGIFVAKEFYSPNYEEPQETDMADLRSTIYWNPRVITDSTGTAQVSFFNADERGTYRVVVEGADLRGHIGRQTLRYKVN